MRFDNVDGFQFQCVEEEDVAAGWGDVRCAWRARGRV